MKVLIVDDSKFSRKRVLSALADQGHEVHQACDGAEGFKLFQQEQPDLVISDLLMPNVDGIEQLRMIRDSGSMTPVVVVTADIQESTQAICREFGSVNFLNKPFKPQELLDAIEEVFDLHNKVVS
ncbi:MAG: response regulator [Planctomycetaceae bacterium]|nr:response regulator [Planctomycetaceae bacterium]